MSLPLDGITVLDFSSLLPGPLASLMLAEAGAEVIKVERAGTGEEMRRDDAQFALLNRGKRSIAIDLKSAGAFDRLRPLILGADIVIEQFRPGVMERLGLGWEALHAVNPRLIYCAINGYGSTGPKAARPGHDLTYAAEAGVLAQTAGADGAPGMPPVLAADIAGGSYPAVINILLALLARERTGHGARIEIAMFDNLLPLMFASLASAYGHGHWPTPGNSIETGGSPRYNLYRTRDGQFLALASAEDRFWANFCRIAGIATSAAADAVAAAIGDRTAAEWGDLLDGEEVIAAIVRSVEEAMADPQIATLLARGTALYRDKSLPALPVALDPGVRRTETSLAAPELGEANAALLTP